MELSEIFIIRYLRADGTLKNNLQRVFSFGLTKLYTYLFESNCEIQRPYIIIIIKIVICRVLEFRVEHSWMRKMRRFYVAYYNTTERNYSNDHNYGSSNIYIYSRHLRFKYAPITI